MTALPYMSAIYPKSPLMMSTASAQPSPLGFAPQQIQRRPDLGFGINGSRGPGALSDLLTSVGMGLLMGKNPGEGVGLGLQQFNQMSADRRQEDRQNRRDQMLEQQFQQEQAKLQAEQEQLAQFNQMIDRMNLPEDKKNFILAMGPGSASFKEVFPGAEKPDLTTFYEGDQQYQGYLGPDNKPVRVTPNSPRWAPKSEQNMAIDFNNDGTPDFVMGGGAVKLTEAQGKDTAWASRLEGAMGDMDSAEADGYDPTATSVGGVADYIGQRNVGGLVGNAMTSDKGKKWYRGAKETLAVILRKDSGGAITPEEFSMYGPIYLPMPWDDPSTKASKKQSLRVMLGSLKTTSGGGYDANKARMDAETPPPAPAQNGAPTIVDGYTITPVD